MDMRAGLWAAKLLMVDHRNFLRGIYPVARALALSIASELATDRTQVKRASFGRRYASY
ncbi:hypothetical protein KCP75_07530 [Salmonella enterica subsp. enterica]|nr:hypothetical protein KCP75_07530 [Salmonella enterica subsp. enterica]